MKYFFLIVLFYISSLTMIISQTTISGGDVSGIWDISGSPYHILDDIIIQPGATLVIEAGVTVESEMNVDIKVLGRLLAIGEEENIITFTAINQNFNGWGGIEFHDSAFDDSQISHVIIEYAVAGIYIDKAFPTIRNVTLSNNDSGIYAELNYATGGGINYFSEIEFINNQAGYYSDSYFNAQFHNCIFNNNQYGILLWYGTNLYPFIKFFNCIITNNTTGLYSQGGKFIRLENCTVTNNDNEEIKLKNPQIKDTIINSIIWGGAFEDGIAFEGINYGLATSNSNISKFSGIFPGTGNINADPLFVDPAISDFRLMANSPA